MLAFTSDHGDMLQSQGETKKQKPWDESIRVPLLVRTPAPPGRGGREIDLPVSTPDLMPTLLRVCGLKVPDTVEGRDLSGLIGEAGGAGKNDAHQESDYEDGVLITCPVPFHQWNVHRGGREYRGIRTRRYTYVCDLNGPWLLYDNLEDPYQLRNLIDDSATAGLREAMDQQLREMLARSGDEFLPGPAYMRRWDYDWDGDDGYS